jgi:hypothetical protein
LKVIHHQFRVRGIPAGCEIFRKGKPLNEGSRPGRKRCLDGVADHLPISAQFEIR